MRGAGNSKAIITEAIIINERLVEKRLSDDASRYCYFVSLRNMVTKKEHRDEAED
jgi:hypothetical protein